MRSTHRVVAGLTVLATITAGCAAEGPAVEHGEAPASAADTEQPDEDSSSDTRHESSRPSRPNTPTASPEPATRPNTEPTTRPNTEPTTPPTAAPATEPAAKPPPAPEPAPKAAVIADGPHAGRLAGISASNVTVQLVRVLSGAEAIAAAKADGGAGLDDDGTLPNDVYVQDLERTVTIPVAGDGGFRIYDCSGGCELVGTTLTALVSGEAVPYGGPNAVINLQVDQGVVVSFEEQYLP